MEALEFEWDEEKASSNHDKHGIAFEDAALIFRDSRRVVREDTREDYGEKRYQTIGRAGALVLFVAYTIRRARYRLITARRASSEEREAYHGDR